MQETTAQLLTAPEETGSLVASAERAAAWAGEPFLHPEEDPGQVLAPGTARRRALDDALAEIDAGSEGALDRLEDPLRADARPRARAEREAAPSEVRHRAAPPPGGRARRDADRADRRRAAPARGGRSTRSRTSTTRRSTRTARTARTATTLRTSLEELEVGRRALAAGGPGRDPPLPLPPPDRVRQDDRRRRLRRGRAHDRRPDPHPPPPAGHPVQPRAEGRGLRRPDHAGDHRHGHAAASAIRSRSRPTPGSPGT